MFIKTVSTTSGINPIKFDETGGVFYWILNTGSSTIYASTKSAFTAGDDGVVSLGPKESRRLETNNDTIYILGEGQVEIHNQRDGICSFKQAPTSSGSGGGGTVDAYSKTESDAKYAQKTDIPTTLPANGGNADTVDGYHVDNFIHASESTSPEYITEFLRINNDTKSIERWDTNNLKVAFANNAAKAKNAGNADTVDGLHANDFIQIVDFRESETDTKTAIGQPGKTAIYRCTKWTNYPAEFIDSQGTLIAVNYNGSGAVETDRIWCTQIIVNPRSGNKMFIRYTDATSISDWKEISTTPIKSTTFSANADGTGNFNLWAPSENKVPISIQFDNKPFYAVPFLYNNQMWLGSTINEGTRQPVTSTTVSGTVYYI